MRATQVITNNRPARVFFSLSLFFNPGIKNAKVRQHAGRHYDHLY